MAKATAGPRRRHGTAADAGSRERTVHFGQGRRRRPFAGRAGRPSRRLSAAKGAPLSALRKRPLGDSQTPNNGFNCRLQLPFDTGLLAPDDAKDKVFVAIVKALLVLENVPSNPYELATFIVENDIEHIGGLTPKQTVSSRISQHFKRVSKSLDPQRVATLAKTQSKDSTRKLRYCLNPRAGLPGVPVPRLRPDERLQSDNIPLYTPAKRRQSAGQATPHPAKGPPAQNSTTSLLGRGMLARGSLSAPASGKFKPAGAGCHSCKADRRNSSTFTATADVPPPTPNLTKAAADKYGWRKQTGGECPSRESNAPNSQCLVDKADGPFPDHEPVNQEPNKAGYAGVLGSLRNPRLKHAGGKYAQLEPSRRGNQEQIREGDNVSSTPQPFKQDLFSDDEAPKMYELDLGCVQFPTKKLATSEGDASSDCNKRAWPTSADLCDEPVVNPISPAQSPIFSQSEAKRSVEMPQQAFRQPDAQISKSPKKELASLEMNFHSPFTTLVECRVQTGAQIACSTGVDERRTPGVDPTSPTPLPMRPPSSDAYLTSVTADFTLSPLFDAAAPTDEDEDLCKFIQQYSPLNLSCDDFAVCSSPYSGPENAWESCPRLDMDVWDVLAVVSWPRTDSDSDPSVPLFHFTETGFCESSHPLDVEAPAVKPTFESVIRDDTTISTAVCSLDSPRKVCVGVQEEAPNCPSAPSEIVRSCEVAEDGVIAEKSSRLAEQPSEQASASWHDNSVCNSDVSTVVETINFCDEARQRMRRSLGAGPSRSSIPCSRNGRVAFNFEATEAGGKASTSARPTSRQASSAAALSTVFTILRNSTAAVDDSEISSADANANEPDRCAAEGSQPRQPGAEPLSSLATTHRYGNPACNSQVTKADTSANRSSRSAAERRHEHVWTTGSSFSLSASRQSKAVVIDAEASDAGGASKKLGRPGAGQAKHQTSAAGPPALLALTRSASRHVPALSPPPSDGSDPSDDEGKRGTGNLSRRAAWETETTRKKRGRKSNARHPWKHDNPRDSSEHQSDRGRAEKGSRAGRGRKRQKSAASGDVGGRHGDEADDCGRGRRAAGRYAADERLESAKAALAGVGNLQNIRGASLHEVPVGTGSSVAANAEPPAANGTAAIPRTTAGKLASPPIYMTVIDLVPVYAVHVTVKAPGSSSPDDDGIRSSPAEGEFVTCKLLRMVDYGFVNGTALLRAGQMGECERSAMLALEAARIRVRKQDSELNGTWIPLERARELAAKFSLLGKVGAFLDDDLDVYFSSPPPNASTASRAGAAPPPASVSVSTAPPRRRTSPKGAPEPAARSGGERANISDAEEVSAGGRESRRFRPDRPPIRHGRGTAVVSSENERS